MLATPYFPRYVWLATMGLSYLTPDRMEPLRGRRIVLYPDVGCLPAQAHSCIIQPQKAGPTLWADYRLVP